MYCNNAQHQAQSPYSTSTNDGGLLWTNTTIMGIESSPTIAADGTIYFGSYHYLYAFNPNGTHKWTFTARLIGTSSYAIGNDGTIYFGTEEDYFYAVNPNGTLRWTFSTQSMIDSPPVLDQDGTIYFGTVDTGILYALLPNGTEKWEFTTQDTIFTSPAVGNDGTIYCSSNDNHLYSLYPNNGTMKWSASFGNFIGSPTVANDGTIYEASLDGYLYALNSNGTQRWKSAIGTGCAHCPSIGSDGTIYIGAEKLYAITPTGALKWSFDAGSGFAASSDAQAISSDGTIYYAVSMGSQRGDIIAVNSDGSQKWRETIANEWVWSSPAIGKDGTVYIGSTSMGTTPYGVLYAFNGEPFDPITIEKPVQGRLYFIDKEIHSTHSGVTLCIGPITIQATHPEPTEVVKVEFFLDGQKQITIQNPPYQWTYRKLGFGQHTITVTATNDIGATRSDSITIIKLF